MTDSLPKAANGVEASDVGGETLLISGDDIHVLNETAAFIWKLCDGAHTTAEIEAALREEYAVPPEHDAAADIVHTLADLKAKGLLVDG